MNISILFNEEVISTKFYPNFKHGFLLIDMSNLKKTLRKTES